jgi:hypothetical protein
MDKTLYQISISEILGEDYVDLVNDMVRLVIIQIAIQTMLIIGDPEHYSFFSGDFGILILFIVIGVMFYWLVFKKFISFV